MAFTQSKSSKSACSIWKGKYVVNFIFTIKKFEKNFSSVSSSNCDRCYFFVKKNYSTAVVASRLIRLVSYKVQRLIRGRSWSGMFASCRMTRILCLLNLCSCNWWRSSRMARGKHSRPRPSPYQTLRKHQVVPGHTSVHHRQSHLRKRQAYHCYRNRLEIDEQNFFQVRK